MLAIEEYEKTLDVGELHSLAMIKHYMELIAASEDAFLWNIVNDLLDLYESSSLKEIMTRHLGFSSVDLFISHVLFSRDVFALGDRLPLVDDVASVMKPPSF